MSETPTTEVAASSADSAAPAPSPIAASLYPNGGDREEGDQSPSGTTDEPTSPLAAQSGEGADSVAGTEGAESTAATAGEDSVSGSEGIDPASYEFTFPDGFTVQDDVLSEARTALAEAGVPKDKAQGLANVFVKALESAAQSQVSAIEAQQTEWLTEINAMPEFQGQTREKSLQTIGALVDQHPGLKDVLSDPRVGNNPAMARFMLKVATQLSEGTPTAPGGTPEGANRRGPRSLGSSLYPDGVRDAELANQRT